MGSRDAGVIVLLAGDSAGQCWSRRRCWRRRSPSIRATVRRTACSPQPYVRRPHGLDRHGRCYAIAERAALAAILADSEDPWAHLALGSVYLFKRRFDDSLAEFELALRLNPNFSLAQGYYGLALSYSGRWEEADAAARRALRLSPRDPFSAVYYGIAAYAQFSGRNYDEAIRLSREGIRQRSDFVGAHRVLTAAAGMAGQTDIASVALQELRRAQPNISLAWIARQMPIKLDAEREHYLEGFRRAGLGMTFEPTY